MVVTAAGAAGGATAMEPVHHTGLSAKLWIAIYFVHIFKERILAENSGGGSGHVASCPPSSSQAATTATTPRKIREAMAGALLATPLLALR